MNRIDKWEDLYAKTNRLNRPFSIDNLLTEKEILELEKTIIKILNIFLDRGELHKGIKIYVNKILRNDIVDKMLKIRPAENESLGEWSMKIFGKEKF